MKGLIELNVDMKIIIFLERNELIIRHELVFNFDKSLETGVDPFHGSLILINLRGFAERIFYPFFEFGEREKRGIHLF